MSCSGCIVGAAYTTQLGLLSSIAASSVKTLQQPTSVRDQLSCIYHEALCTNQQFAKHVRCAVAPSVHLRPPMPHGMAETPHGTSFFFFFSDAE